MADERSDGPEERDEGILDKVSSAVEGALDKVRAADVQQPPLGAGEAKHHTYADDESHGG